MAPKKEVDIAAAETIKSLCYLMSTASEFTPNLNEAFVYLGLNEKKNA